MLILGITYAIDSAAAIVRDGRVLAASAEERFSRIKHDRAFPTSAIQFCLKSAKAGLEEVDAVAFFWNPGIHAEAFQRRQSGEPRHHLEYLYNVANQLLPMLGRERVETVEERFRLSGGKSLRIVFVTHHWAHAACAFFPSPFDEAAVLTVDGYGERTSALISDASGVSVRPVAEVEYPHSVGSVYAALTEYLGFKANSGEGKVMGLAAYGQPRYRDEFSKIIRPTEQGFEVDQRYFEYTLPRSTRYSRHLIERLGAPRDPSEPISERHQDIAASLQLATEEILVHLARLARKHTGRKNLCATGGVMLNCVANTRIVREAGFERCFFQPAASDAGAALGAALWVEHCLEGRPRHRADPSDYLGLEASSEEIEGLLGLARVPFRRLSDPATEAARRLSQGRILGWFQGRTEYGPRALGNRSILADPRKAEMKDVLNARVKFREPFRPFAPGVLEERCAELFDSPEPSPFMLRVYRTLPEKLQTIPSVTHVDGWARVQTVTRRQNQPYYDLIKAFGEATGVPVILNTSFNIRGEPIVNTPAEALRCFASTGMDDLVMGDFLLSKDPIPS